MTAAAHLAPYDPLHLFIRSNWSAGQVRVGVADALGAGQEEAARPARCPRHGGVLHRHVVGMRASYTWRRTDKTEMVKSTVVCPIKWLPVFTVHWTGASPVGGNAGSAVGRRKQ